MHYPPSFKAVANQAQRLAPKITHKERVMRLYRKSLKLMISWAYERELVNQEAERIRAEFDACRGMSESQAAGAIRRTEEELARLTHPDPIVHAYMPGGSKFMRNAPLPMEVVYPNGLPEGMTPPTPVHVDQVPITIRPMEENQYDTVLVDFYKKGYSYFREGDDEPKVQE